MCDVPEHVDHVPHVQRACSKNVMQDLANEYGKPFSLGMCMVCHDVSVDCCWRAYVQRSAQASTWGPPKSYLQSDALVDPARVNGKRVDLHVFDTVGCPGCDVTIVDPACPSY
jgi:hypothetical protein